MEQSILPPELFVSIIPSVLCLDFYAHRYLSLVCNYFRTCVAKCQIAPHHIKETRDAVKVVFISKGTFRIEVVHFSYSLPNGVRHGPRFFYTADFKLSMEYFNGQQPHFVNKKRRTAEFYEKGSKTKYSMIEDEDHRFNFFFGDTKFCTVSDWEIVIPRITTPVCCDGPNFTLDRKGGKWSMRNHDMEFPDPPFDPVGAIRQLGSLLDYIRGIEKMVKNHGFGQHRSRKRPRPDDDESDSDYHIEV